MNRAGRTSKATVLAISVSVVALLALAASQSVVFVPANQTAVVLRKGRTVRLDNADGRAPGLYLKTPLAEQVVRLDRRTLTAESRVMGVADSSGQRLDVATLALYRIGDARLASREADADASTQVAEWVDGAVRSHVAGSSAAGLEGPGHTGPSKAVLSAVRRAAAQARSGLDIEALQVIYVAPASGESADLEHLRSDLATRAAQVRADGETAKQAALASADREAADIRARGEEQALEIRGQGDAQRAEILGAAYAQDPDFARFFRRLEAYDQALDPATTTLVLNPAEGFLDLFGKGPGKAGPAP